MENELTGFLDVYFQQANVFSALVSIYATKALSAFSVYEKPRHLDHAQQRFPDLKKKGSKYPPAPEESLECKASKRIWALQAHYDHPGWYIVWRYAVNEAIPEAVIWRVDVAFLKKADWKYEGSGVGASGGGRTHTFGLRKPSKALDGKAVYSRSDVVVRGGKAIFRNGDLQRFSALERLFRKRILAPSEQALNVGELEFDIGGAAVAALARVGGDLHFPQQRVHFRTIE